MGDGGEIGACERAGMQGDNMTGPIAKDKAVDVFLFRTRSVPLVLPPFQPQPVLRQLHPPYLR